MANNTNSITVVGNLTRDPEMRYTASGVSTATFGVAVNRSWRNQQTNEWEERTSFFNIVCWRGLAENVAASLKKGTRIVATGPARAAQLGDRAGREALGRRDRRRRGRARACCSRRPRCTGSSAAAPATAAPAAQPAAAAGAALPATENYDEYGEEPF